jgi:hypothetical protein
MSCQIATPLGPVAVSSGCRPLAFSAARRRLSTAARALMDSICPAGDTEETSLFRSLAQAANWHGNQGHDKTSPYK